MELAKLIAFLDDDIEVKTEIDKVRSENNGLVHQNEMVVKIHTFGEEKIQKCQNLINGYIHNDIFIIYNI
jgi:hypothetical protein